MPQKLLFAGSPEPLGGLTNEEELPKHVPRSFSGTILGQSMQCSFFTRAEISETGSGNPRTKM